MATVLVLSNRCTRHGVLIPFFSIVSGDNLPSKGNLVGLLIGIHIRGIQIMNAV